MKKRLEKLAMKGSKLLILILLFVSVSTLWGQTISGVSAQSPVDFAADSDFSVGELTIRFNMPTGQTAGELDVKLAAGIEYIPNTVTATNATITLKTGSTDANRPVFSFTNASGAVTIKLKRKAIKAVLTNTALATGLKDRAVLTIGGVSTNPAKESNLYQLQRPTLTVQLPVTASDALGARTENFDIRNTGNGKVKDVYFSIAYPEDVVGESVSYNGTPLTQVGVVPVGLPNAGKPIYKIPDANLLNNQKVTITEKYKVSKCTGGRQNTYYAYWGSSHADIFETQFNTKNITVSTGTPIINYDGNNAFTYFEWKDGFCGNVLGTFYVRYNNNAATDKGIAYNLEIRLLDEENSVQFSNYEPDNIRLIARDGTTVSLPATVGHSDRRHIVLTNLAVLSTTSLAGKDVGLTDEDGDGFKDDLKKGAYFQIAFDLKKKAGVRCLQPGRGTNAMFSVQPSSYILYDNVCTGERIWSNLHSIHHNTLRVYFNGVNDASKLPVQLVQNVSSAGYISPGMNWPSLVANQKLRNGNTTNNERKFKYVITTPAGIKLQNVKLYRKTNIFGASTERPVDQSDVAPGTTATFVTTNTSSDPDSTPGYLSFDALLQNCNGATAPITYSVYLMLKNGNSSYCDVPLVCNQTVNIPTICDSPCSIQGPSILSTVVERADNSYGWKDHNMNARQIRANVSPLERMRALYLDDIEFISQGRQHASATANNLFYYVKVENTAELEPKGISLKVNGGAVQSFTATATNPARGTNAAGKKFFRWDLTTLLPSRTLAAGATFTAVATYQVKNANTANSYERTVDVQSGIESFFYTVNNLDTDTAIGTEGYHTAQKHCGANLTPVFYIAETRHLLATNRYTQLAGCSAAPLGANLVYGARRFKSGGSYFSQEFRPARLIKKITMRMPSAYRIKNIEYTYATAVGQTAAATVDMNNLAVADDGTWKTYTYINPAKGHPGHLPAGMLTVENEYNEYIKPFIQPSCKSKTVDGNKAEVQQDNDALTMQEKIDTNIEYDDFYYHYAETTQSAPATDYLNDRPILFRESDKPEIKIDAISSLTVKANKREMEATFKLSNTKNQDAPYGWISIPEVAGIEIISLEETTGGGYTYTPQGSIAGEKMFFLSDKGDEGKIVRNTQRQFKLKYKVTSCATSLQLKVYAGWNCWENPTTGYRNTCSDKFITYNITVAKSKKEIAAASTNPGQDKADKKGTIPMCAATSYSYEINSAEEGDLYDTKLVVTRGEGITFSNVTVEYPLASGFIYHVGTGTEDILHTTVGNKDIYDLSHVLPGGSLPGSISEPINANNRKLKLTFDVTPDCNFSAGSSFDIEVEGNNLCGRPALGDKSSAILAGIQGVNVDNYTITLDPLTEYNDPRYNFHNASYCDNGIIYITKVTVNSPDPTFEMLDKARLRFTLPEGYELAAGRNVFKGNRSGSFDWDEPERVASEERTLSQGSEVVLTVPENMKAGDWFIAGIRIKQKNVLVPCDRPLKLKAITTDEKGGVACPSSGNTCPKLLVSTSSEVEVAIKNERPTISIEDLTTTSVAEGGKEKLTIKYKLKNDTGAAAALTNGMVKATLYYDANNNGIADSADTILTSHTSTGLNLPQGTTSPEQTFTFAVDQDKVCRLLLVLKNEDNVCLCGDVIGQIIPPTQTSGLVDNVTVCESETKQLTYSVAGADYISYTWTGKTASDKLTYLSDRNIKEPNFRYTGAKLTATTTFTYILKVKRTNGCEATQEVKVIVQPAPSITTQPVEPSSYCVGDPATTLTVVADTHGLAGTLSYQWYKNTINSTTGGTPVGTNATNYTPLTTTAGTLYYYVKVTNNSCGEAISRVVKVVVNAIPAKPTFTITAENCSAPTIVKVANYEGGTYTFTKADGTSVTTASVAMDGVISGLTVGTYKVKVTKDGCVSEISDVFEIKAKKSVPAKPTLRLTAESCTAPTKVVISNYVTGQTYWNGTERLTVDTATHEITGLAAGTYTITTKNTDCESVASDSFEIKAQKSVPAKPTLRLTAESCTAPTKVVISNYVTGQTYWNGTERLTVDTATHEITGLAVGTYTITAKNTDCESVASDSFEIKAQKSVPAKPTLALTAESCTAPTKVVISNYVAGQTYWNGTERLSVDTTTHEITGLTAGTYTITTKNTDCESVASDSFEIKAQKTTPSKPTFMVTAENCSSPTVVKIATHEDGFTYDFTKADGTPVTGASVAADGTISGLEVGTYKVKATKDGCVSEISDTFEIKAQKAAVVITTNPVGATYIKDVTAAALTVVATGEGSLTYKWYRNTTNSYVGGSEVATTTTYTPATNVVGSLFYWAEVTNECGTVRSAIAEIKVTIVPFTIEANDDPHTSVYKGGEVEILSNDHVNGNPATPTNVDITIPDEGNLTGVTINPATGKIKVPNDAPPGTYEITYQICVRGAIAPCDTAKVKITVIPDTIEANNDPDTTVAKGGEVDILHNDRVNGSPATPTNVDITIANEGGLTGVTADPATGKLKVPSNARPGTYNVEYRICVKGATSPCDTAKVKITVTPDATPTIKANNDPDTTVVKGGEVEVLDNDRVNGNPATPANVDITIANGGGLTGVTADPATGKIKVPTNATPGTYEVEYRICVKGATSPCDTAKVKITVTPDATPTINANNDPDTTVAKGGVVEVLGNDRVNGSPATPTNVDITIANDGGLTGVTANPTTGKIKVPANARPGTYEVEYRICVKGATAPCDTAKVKITVTEDMAATIEANDDPDTTVAKGGEVNILHNDRVNGSPATPTNVDITIPTDGGLTGVTINPTTGKIKVPNNANPGTYELTYQICVRGEIAPCDTAKVKITVTPDATPTINANDDPDTIVAKGGVVEVLDNDRVNGSPATPTNVDITIANDGGLTGVTVDPATGKIKVPNDATPGTYEVEYRICVKGATSPCDTAKVKITITGDTAETIEANDDPDTTGTRGGEVDVLGNDRVNGAPADIIRVNMSIPDDGGLTGIDINMVNGKLRIPNTAQAGTYEITYKICLKTDTNICDIAKVKIAIPNRTIKALDDNFGKVPNTLDYTTTNTVFSSGIDTLEGVPGILSPETDVILHKGEVARQDGAAVQAGTITMNNNGSITVKAGTPVGVYTYTYKICEKAVPTNCSEEAKVIFEVVDNTILAKDDEYEVGTLGGLTPSILNNDILKGKVGLTAEDVEIEDTAGQARADDHLKIGEDGRITVKPGIAARPEPYLYYYTIKEKASPTNTSNAIIKIKVVSFVAGDDEHEVPNNNDKRQHIEKPSIFDNDEVDGKRPKPGDNVTFTPTPVKDKDGNEVPGIVINPQDGTITIEANTPDGVYTYNYTICKKTAPNECKTAKGILKLLPALVAVDDPDFKPVNTTKGAVNVGNVLKNDKYAGEEALNNLDKLTAVIADNDGLVGAKIDEQGNLIIPQGTPVRVYNPTYYLCMKDHPGVCKIAKIRVEVIKDKPLTIYNGVSADGDGHNDYFNIDGIEYYPKNNLKIFNRWGVLVYEKDGYSNEDPFDGHSNGRATISADSKLPQGTYYYILEYEDSDDQSHTEKGWLYLKY